MNTLIWVEHIIGLVNLPVIIVLTVIIMFERLDIPEEICLSLEFGADLGLVYGLLGGFAVAVMR